MILLDASGLYTAISARESGHAEVAAVLRSSPGPFVLSPFVLAEVDYLVATRAGLRHELRLLDEVAGGTYELVGFAAPDIAEASGVIESYGDLEIGLADASIVVLAGRFGTEDVLTLDERHFRTLRSPRGRPFRLLPADA